MRWSCKEGTKHISLYCGGVLVLKLDKGGLTALQLQTKTKVKVSSKKKKKANVCLKDAKMFANAYQNEKAIFFHNPALKKVSPLEGKNIDHFRKALELCRLHGVQPKKFIKAQVEGMKWMKDGKGQFPFPTQLSNHSAEIRLLEYISSDGKPAVVVSISKEDRQLPLGDNGKYLITVSKIRNNQANLAETLYVQELQKIRRGKVAKFVMEYLEKFNSKED